METREKKSYDTPVLRVWGSLRDLTQAHFGNLDYKNGTPQDPNGPPV